ncbi:putative hemolysin [Pantoea anthophila]|nr:putative hemolysin [Pantoea anthophila]
MMTIKQISGISVILLALQLTACAPRVKEPQRMAMRNPASVWCLQHGGREEQGASSTDSTRYCLLPSGERIEQWELYHRDHPQ